MKPGPTITLEGGLDWGATFWSLRKAIGQYVADRVLYACWARVTLADIRKNNTADFARMVLNSVGGEDAGVVVRVFEERGLHLTYP